MPSSAWSASPRRFYAICSAPSFRVAARLGAVFGGVSTALSSFWLMFFQGFSVWTYGGTILGYMGYNALLFPFLLGFSRVSARFRPFLLAVGWAMYEYFKSIGFLGYPWGLVAYPVGGILPLIQFVDITGVWGLSFLMALINALIAEYALGGWRPRFRRQGAFVVFLVAARLSMAPSSWQRRSRRRPPPISSWCSRTPTRGAAATARAPRTAWT